MRAADSLLGAAGVWQGEPQLCGELGWVGGGLVGLELAGLDWD